MKFGPRYRLPLARIGPILGVMLTKVAPSGEDHAAARSFARGGFARVVLAGLLVPVLIITVGLVFGLVRFVNGLATEEGAAPPRADAIVALTGGSDRIADALELLARGQARRLLISGVHETTSPEKLRRLLPGHDHLFECCIDLDYRARNTLGNAQEARDWALRNEFRSLIIVTSTYHMPRTLLEVQRNLPRAQLIPHPVVTAHAPLGGWWRDPRMVKLLGIEYLKYLVARLRADLTTPEEGGLPSTALANRRPRG